MRRNELKSGVLVAVMAGGLFVVLLLPLFVSQSGTALATPVKMDTQNGGSSTQSNRGMQGVTLVLHAAKTSSEVAIPLGHELSLSGDVNSGHATSPANLSATNQSLRLWAFASLRRFIGR
jgi:hypothetical protein